MDRHSTRGLRLQQQTGLCTSRFDPSDWPCPSAAAELIEHEHHGGIERCWDRHPRFMRLLGRLSTHRPSFGCQRRISNSELDFDRSNLPGHVGLDLDIAIRAGQFPKGVEVMDFRAQPVCTRHQRILFGRSGSTSDGLVLGPALPRTVSVHTERRALRASETRLRFDDLPQP